MILSAHDESMTLWVWYSQRMLIFSAGASACGTESMILPAHAEAHAESISMRWEYHTLSIILPACAESISHAESMIFSILLCNQSPPKVIAYQFSSKKMIEKSLKCSHRRIWYYYLLTRTIHMLIINNFFVYELLCCFKRNSTIRVWTGMIKPMLILLG